MKAIIDKESRGLLRLVKFKKTNGQKQEIMGVECYKMDCSLEVIANETCALEGFQGSGWDGRFFAKKLQRGDYIGFSKPLTKGASHGFTTSLDFELTEKGWRTRGLLPADTPFVSEVPGQTVNPPAPAPTPTPPAPAPSPTTPAAKTTVWKSVCRAGSLGEFRHGTKCVGYYDYDEAAQKWRMVEITLPGQEATKNYKKSKGLAHAGVDVVATEGSEVYPVADGAVQDIIADANDVNFKSLGYMVLVKHKDKTNDKDTFSLYLHLKESPKVQKEQSVTAGQTVLGLVGQTGAAFGPHVHFEIRHFPERLFGDWRNIYGITSPAEEATFKETDFSQNWVEPEQFSLSAQPLAAAPAPAQQSPLNPNQSQTTVALLDPRTLIQACVTVRTSEQGRRSAILNAEAFDSTYKNKRVRYVGVIGSVKKPAGPVEFQKGGEWPLNWHVETPIPEGKKELVDNLQKGQQLTIEGDVCELQMPRPDTALFGSSRTIRLQNARIVEK